MPRKYTPRVQRACFRCGAEFTARPSRVKNGRARYCSTACLYNRAATPAVMSHDGLTARLRVRVRPSEPDAHTIIDAIDAPWAEQWMWSLNIGGYVTRPRLAGDPSDGPRRIFLHREILNLSTESRLEGDHINRDKLDNRRRNLRVVTRMQNAQNVSSCEGSSSIYRGVTWYRQLGKWHAQVRSGGKTHHFGYFSDEIEAAEAARIGRSILHPFAHD
jgi:hypothetical protein